VNQECQEFFFSGVIRRDDLAAKCEKIRKTVICEPKKNRRWTLLNRHENARTRNLRATPSAALWPFAAIDENRDVSLYLKALRVNLCLENETERDRFGFSELAESGF